MFNVVNCRRQGLTIELIGFNTRTTQNKSKIGYFSVAIDVNKSAAVGHQHSILVILARNIFDIFGPCAGLDTSSFFFLSMFDQEYSNPTVNRNDKNSSYQLENTKYNGHYRGYRTS